jgi:hypothetical protein
MTYNGVYKDKTPRKSIEMDSCDKKGNPQRCQESLRRK